MTGGALLKICLWSLVIWLVLLVLAANIAQAATERADIEARLPLPHPVFCADSDAEWARLTAKIGDVAAYTWVDPSSRLFRTMWFSPATCKAWAGPKNALFADAAQTLYHEWFHAEFLTPNEGETECLALYIYRYEMRHQWGMTPAQATKLYRLAWVAHVRLGLLFPAYRGTCGQWPPDLAPRVRAR